MQRSAIAKRYAQAVFEIAEETNAFDRWMADLEQLAAALDEGQLVAVLESPKARVEDRTRLLTARFANVSPLALNLALLLASKGRFPIVGQVRDEYEELLNDHRNVAIAEATTVVELSPAEKDKLAEQLGQLTGKRIVLRTKVDPAIGGGLLARIGDRVIDGTVRTRLALLKDQLAI